MLKHGKEDFSQAHSDRCRLATGVLPSWGEAWLSTEKNEFIPEEQGGKLLNQNILAQDRPSTSPGERESDQRNQIQVFLLT